MAKLILSDGTVFEGQSFGATVDTDGEVVFNTGMVGYPESLTDPSYQGQILVFTYPLIGNYGVPSMEKNEFGFSKNFESEAVQVRGVVVAQVSDEYSHFSAASSLQNFLEHFGIPGITGVDTRALTKKLREHGVMLGRIVQGVGGRESGGGEIADPNLNNLVAEVSCSEVITYEPKTKNETPISIVAYDCGIKRNIIRSWLKRGVTVHRVPWNYDLAKNPSNLKYDGVFVSNGPGDPKMCRETIAAMKWSIEQNIPTFGICLGNQLMALAIGGDTYKLKYGHRGANQPCVEAGSSHCIITSQNHGFAVDEKTLPSGWSVWWRNANDGTVEGIRHESGRFFAVQFHPEATPGPEDANYLFDTFLGVLEQEKVLVEGKK
ncbi:glutamine-hydrolyzing carbamoyl-phosphate synthase small subunit [Candidatus Peregrinibacteria bacterium]|nr:glutamine-hydrolyzing carbamoyl-phosphate synthase small subunit [Candidatus Peregrinibacteria bacterium]